MRPQKVAMSALDTSRLKPTLFLRIHRVLALILAILMPRQEVRGNAILGFDIRTVGRIIIVGHGRVYETNIQAPAEDHL